MKSTAPQIAFFGTPDEAVATLDALESRGILPSLVITMPDRPQGRKLVVTPPPVKVWAEKRGIAVLQPEKLRDEAFLPALSAKGPWDLFIVCAYGKIIPKAVIDMPKRGTINVHPSLLPLLRGPSPLQAAILGDMRETGVTVMRIDEELDHGPILAQEKGSFAAWPVDSRALGQALFSRGGEMIAEILPKLLDGTLPETPQDHSRATFTKKIEKEDGLIDLSGDPYQNFLKWNAYREWPTAYFFMEKDGKRLRVTVLEAAYEGGSFVLRKVRVEGKNAMSEAEFSRWKNS